MGKGSRTHLTIFHLRTWYSNKYCHYVIYTYPPALHNLCLPLAKRQNFLDMPVQRGRKLGVRTLTSSFSTLTSPDKSKGECSSVGFGPLVTYYVCINQMHRCVSTKKYLSYSFPPPVFYSTHIPV